MTTYDEPTEAERKPSKRGFAKIDVVDVILSDDTYEARNKPNVFEQITETALRQKGLYPDPSKVRCCVNGGDWGKTAHYLYSF